MYLLITLMVVSGLSVSEFIVMKQHLGCSFVNRAKICLEFATCLLELCQKKKEWLLGPLLLRSVSSVSRRNGIFFFSFIQQLTKESWKREWISY